MLRAWTLPNGAVSILVSLLIGLAGFVAAGEIFDWLTPGVNFSDQLHADIQSATIFLAGLSIAPVCWWGTRSSEALGALENGVLIGDHRP
jgi:hypothetical protein